MYAQAVSTEILMNAHEYWLGDQNSACEGISGLEVINALPLSALEKRTTGLSPGPEVPASALERRLFPFPKAGLQYPPGVQVTCCLPANEHSRRAKQIDADFHLCCL